MVNVRTNFSSMYKDTQCNLCQKDLPQTSAHLLECETILSKCSKLNHSVKYQDIFNASESVQLEAARTYSAIFKVKQDLDEKDELSSI